MIEEAALPSNDSYFACAPVGDEHYCWYLCRYLLFPYAAGEGEIRDAEGLDNAASYHYLLIMDQENPVIGKWILENYPEQAGQYVIDLWQIEGA